MNKTKSKAREGRGFALNVQCGKTDLGNGEVSSDEPKCERLHNDGWSPAGCLIRKRLWGQLKASTSLPEDGLVSYPNLNTSHLDQRLVGPARYF